MAKRTPRKKSHKKTILADLPEDERKELLSKIRSVNAKKQWDKKRRLDAEAKRRGIYDEYVTWDKAKKNDFFKHLIMANSGYQTIRAQDYKSLENLKYVLENFDEAMNEREAIRKLVNFLDTNYPESENQAMIKNPARTDTISRVMKAMEFVETYGNSKYLKDLMWAGFEETTFEFHYITMGMTRNLENMRMRKSMKFWEARAEEVRAQAEYVNVKKPKFKR